MFFIRDVIRLGVWHENAQQPLPGLEIDTVAPVGDAQMLSLGHVSTPLTVPDLKEYL